MSGAIGYWSHVASAHERRGFDQPKTHTDYEMASGLQKQRSVLNGLVHCKTSQGPREERLGCEMMLLGKPKITAQRCSKASRDCLAKAP